MSESSSETAPSADSAHDGARGADASPPGKRNDSARASLISMGVALASVGVGVLWLAGVFPLFFASHGPVPPLLKGISFLVVLGPLLFSMLLILVYLLPRKPGAALLLSLLMVMSGVELSFRVLTSFEKAGLVIPSVERGWAAAPEALWDGPVAGFGHVRFTTGRDGFRRFGDPATTRTRVLVIGDSYTHGHCISEGEMYFDRLAQRRPDLEVFAYGCLGYGTLQEFMVLDRYLETIKPDVLVWQFCHNDMVNNLHALECRSPAQNNHVTRPYWEDGRVRWRYPGTLPRWMGWLVPYSHFLRGMEAKVDARRLAAHGTIEPRLTPDSPLYQASAQTTLDLMRRVRERVGAIPILAFSVEQPPWIFSIFQDASAGIGAEYLSEIPQAIDAQRARGVKMDGKPADSHWNSTAHTLAGEILARRVPNRQGWNPREASP